jgi:hypothetical protein
MIAMPALLSERGAHVTRFIGQQQSLRNLVIVVAPEEALRDSAERA